MDERLHPLFRASNDDYRGSGYDRGHLIAAVDHQNSPNTFMLSNTAHANRHNTCYMPYEARGRDELKKKGANRLPASAPATSFS